MIYPLLAGCSHEKEKNNNLWTLGMHIDSEKHLYLKDHCFGGKALVPYAVMMEILFEAALYYFESKKGQVGLVPFGVDDLDLQRAIGMVPGKNADVDISIHSIEEVRTFDGTGDTLGYRLNMSMDALRINKTGKVLGSRHIMSSRVLLVEENNNLSKPADFKHPASVFSGESGEFRYFNFSSDLDDYYRFFYPHHGYLMQGLTGKLGISADDRYIIGEFDCRGKEAGYVMGAQSELYTSPLGLDCSFQYAVFVSRLETLRGRLPVGAKSIRIFKKQPVDGLCGAFVEVLSNSEEMMVGNITIFDRFGEIILMAEEFKFQRSPFSTYDKGEFEKRLVAGRDDESIIWSNLYE